MDEVPTIYEDYGFSKFSNNLEEYVWQLSLDGADEEIGDVTEYGQWCGLIHFSDGDVDVIEHLQISSEEQGFGRQTFYPAVSAIISTNEQGFVWARLFDGTELEKQEKIWAQIVKEYDDWYETYLAEGKYP